jgi:predicted ATPase
VRRGYRLGPLTLPGPDDPADRDGSEAVALFADRARRADASFALDAKTGRVVARLVARLDGMPLAIELAAARVEALGVARLLDRIGDRFILLRRGIGSRPPGSGRWRPPWSGVTGCWMNGSSGCSGRCRCSPGRSRWRGPRRSRGRPRVLAAAHRQ